jgi:hypothetical protein
MTAFEKVFRALLVHYDSAKEAPMAWGASGQGILEPLMFFNEH